VYAARIAAIRERMGAAGVDAAIFPPGADMQYLIGLELARRERPVALVLAREGPTMLLVPEAVEGAETLPVSIDRVLRWKEDEAPDRMLIEHLKDLGLKEGRIALGLRTYYEEMADIHAALPKTQFVSAAPITRPLRERKSSEEIALIGAAAILADRSIALCWSDVREGMTERELAQMTVDRARQAAGMPVETAARAQSGPNTARRHASTSDRRLVRGDLIVLELAVRLHGYWGRVSRTGIIGPPTGRMKTILTMIVEARELSVEQAREGRSAASVYEKARSSLGTRGFAKLVPLQVGEGLGLEPAERPYLSPGYHEHLAVGNIATFVPGIESPGEYGLRSGDVLEISAAGGRFLTGLPEVLVEI
jgi:Xaa-Pro dipeptidase